MARSELNLKCYSRVTSEKSKQMARKKKGRPVHGWLVLDKPLNMTSTSAVARTKRLLSAQKAGHAGTLDPLATGILPLAFGEATKTVSYAMDGEKAYQFTVRWGAETETDDAEGQVVQENDRRPTREDIEACLVNFRGTIEQVPPKFSAIKLDGNRAYDLAREGEAVELQSREVEIKQLELVEISDESTAVFSATCGKGTYVRALARDFGRELGCCGHVIALRRTRVGPFDESSAWTIEKLEQEVEGLESGAEISEVLLPVHATLAGLPHFSLTTTDASRLSRGQGVLMRGRDAPIATGAAYATCKGRLVALVEIARGELRPTRVFNLG